ncbi:MAG: hypothetical protein HGGPFJEG_00340 [Ignavibacteria bacterium]|nr:hypothetical protein [Ignavibacteria bacterium]
MNQKSGENIELLNEKKNSVRNSLDELLSSTKLLISKFNEIKNENTLLKENIKNLNLKISELKLQFTKINTELINRDKEISGLKSIVLSTGDNKVPAKDKSEVKTRIKELISRIDNHLEQYEADS